MANLKPENLDRFDWQKPIREALLELDREKLEQKSGRHRSSHF